MKMKLLFVIDCLGSGGAQRQMVNLAIGLNQRGHEIVIFTYYPDINHFNKILEYSGIQVISKKKFHRYDISIIPYLRNHIINGSYDGVLSFLDTPNFYTEIATVGLKNIILVVSERFMYPLQGMPIDLLIFQQFHRLADYITVNSHHQRERMIKKYAWMKGKITTIYNGLDLKHFDYHPSQNDKDSMEIAFLAIGSVALKKNVFNLIEALFIYRKLYGSVPKVRWVGVINVSGEGKTTFDKANRLLEQYKLSDDWEWLGERSNISELLYEHDALIHPSFYEGLPNVVCEALGCGRPVLVSNVCDHPKLVCDGQNGLLFDPKSPDDIAKAMRKFCMLSVEERLKMGYHSRKYAENNLSLEKYVDKYEQLFITLKHNC
jgi:glycosyltransferase involved in cell wall biosynthesis